MAEFTINILPQDLSATPTVEKIQNAKELFESFFTGAPYEAKVKHEKFPFFVTARDAFDTVTCPECGESIERFGDNEDHEEWWEGCFLEKTHYADSPDLQEEISMPCCEATTKLGDIDFESSAYLAKLSISLQDPPDAASLTSEQISKLQSALGFPIFQITSVRS